MEIKRQTYLSAKDYKQVYYSNVGDVLYMCRYESLDKKKEKYIAKSLWNLSQEKEIPSKEIIDGIEYRLSHVYKKGDMVLVYKASPNELYNLLPSKLLERLYVIDKFESKTRATLYRVNDSTRKSKPNVDESSENPLPPIYRFMSKIHCLILGIDFQIEGNKIVFLK